MVEEYFFNPISWAVNLLSIVFIVILIMMVGSLNHNLEVGTGRYDRLYLDLKQKGADYDGLVQSYDELTCKTRKLVRTTVRGITLCMNPETKALHKIDETDD